MPETAVNQNGELLVVQHDVRLAGEFAIVSFEHQAEFFKGSSQISFGLCVFPPDAPHHAGASFSINNVNHQISRWPKSTDLVSLYARTRSGDAG